MHYNSADKSVPEMWFSFFIVKVIDTRWTLAVPVSMQSICNKLRRTKCWHAINIVYMINGNHWYNVERTVYLHLCMHAQMDITAAWIESNWRQITFMSKSIDLFMKIIWLIAWFKLFMKVIWLAVNSSNYSVQSWSKLEYEYLKLWTIYFDVTVNVQSKCTVPISYNQHL